jgi:hypothetical protein
VLTPGRLTSKEEPLIATLDPEVLLADLGHPPEDDGRFARLVRTGGRRCRIVLMTGTVGVSIEGDHDALLTKPFGLDQLLAALDGD